MMRIKQFNRLDCWLGWACFFVAAFTYWQTVEPSVSFWDCPEYVACAAKGEVGHPPGNTFFLLAGRFFANFAGGDDSQIAIWINRMSALFSAGTILLLFWTLTSFTKRLMTGRGGDAAAITVHEAMLIEGCGVVGALVYTWSDTFWFSAVEAEVYGFSSFMTALTFWLILKWEQQPDTPAADRYLLLIAYIVGLSIGVHLLNLLCLPAIVLIAYFRKHPVVLWWKVLGVVCLSFALIALILFGIIPGVVWLAQQVESVFVSVLKFDYNWGTLVCYLALIVGLLGVLVWLHRTQGKACKHPRVVFNVAAMLLLLLAGYSTYAQVLIRSSANLPMNENAPCNVFALSHYLNREQYGSNPLFYGQTFASEVVATRPSLQYNYNMLFPRMYSNLPEHVRGYKQWSDFEGDLVQVAKPGGGSQTMRVPTFGENMKYFFRYQLGHMYWRYFFWNFCGRQNDLKSNGEADRGNWITGIPVVDQCLVGTQENQPAFIVNNKGHNVYYMLPLLLGLLGMAWQWRQGVKGKQDLLVVLMLFLMTGVAIVVYINQPPYQPRERDYAFAGSFYAFSLWVGMGVAGVHALLSRLLRVHAERHAKYLALGVFVLCLGVPLQMLGQNWDDHDRSDRFLVRDFGENYLASLDPEGIIFTSGDNDTFPLWYALEVEGFRTDTRACNLCYLQTDWYIDQMKSPVYNSPALPIPYRPEQYAGDKMLYSMLRQSYINIPGDSIVPVMKVSLEGKSYLQRQEIMQLAMVDSIARAGWKRPIYFACSVGTSSYVGLEPYFRTVGLAYQIVPSGGGPESVDIERTYDCVMNRFHWGNVNKPGIYLDETALSMCYWHRVVFGRLIEAMLKEGDTERALRVARKCEEVLPSYNIPYDYTSLSLARCYATCLLQEEANRVSLGLLEQTNDYLQWVIRLDESRRRSCRLEMYRNLSLMQGALLLLEEQKQSDLLQMYYPLFHTYYEQYKKLK